MGRYDWEGKSNPRDRPAKLSGLGGLAIILAVASAIWLIAFYMVRSTGDDRSTTSNGTTRIKHSELLSEPDFAHSPKARSGSVTPTEINTTTPPGPLRVFAKCGARRITCVVDGDTFWMDGEKIRIADIDTPEISGPLCPEERALGLAATDRLIGLLNDGPFELEPSDRDRDRFGRKLRVVVRNGRSLGEELIEEGLAHRWNGHKEPWCT